jgi:hypothetical protein
VPQGLWLVAPFFTVLLFHKEGKHDLAVAFQIPLAHQPRAWFKAIIIKGYFFGAKIRLPIRRS